MLYPWFVLHLSVDGHLCHIPTLNEVHGELFFSFQAGSSFTSWTVWPFSKAAIEVNCNMSTKVTKGALVDVMHAG